MATITVMFRNKETDTQRAAQKGTDSALKRKRLHSSIIVNSHGLNRLHH